MILPTADPWLTLQHTRVTGGPRKIWRSRNKLTARIFTGYLDKYESFGPAFPKMGAMNSPATVKQFPEAADEWGHNQIAVFILHPK